MQAHGRFEQEAWRYDARTLDAYRDYVLLHERLVPYIRAAAATAARSGLPIIRPLAWPIRGTRAAGRSPTPTARAVAVGRARCSRRAHRSAWPTSRAGDGSTSGPGAVTGGRELSVPAPLDRIPVWVRAGSIVVTYPAEHVAAGLGYDAEARSPAGGDPMGQPAGRAGSGEAGRRHAGALAPRSWSRQPPGPRRDPRPER